MQLRRYQAGEVILRENDMGETAYIIERGQVEIAKGLHGQNIRLALLGTGEIFGEMSIIEDKPRSATVIAIEDTVVREIHRDELFHSLQTSPDMALNLLRHLFDRLRAAHVTILQYHFSDRLYGELLERSVRYFFPTGRLTMLGPNTSSRQVLTYHSQQDTVLELEWLHARYALSKPSKPFTPHENCLLKSIGNVLSARYHLLFNADLAAQSFHLFRGLPEDRYISAFLDPDPYSNVEALPHITDRVAEAIEVLRVSALTTYENHRITTGPCCRAAARCVSPLPSGTRCSTVFGRADLDPQLSSPLRCTPGPGESDGLMATSLTSSNGRSPPGTLPVPSTSRYQAHCRATLVGSHLPDPDAQ
jgi:CRP-like cAMP-binding protein